LAKDEIANHQSAHGAMRRLMIPGELLSTARIGAIKPEFGRTRRATKNVQGNLEATSGIEPEYTDLQSAASPLRHVASQRSTYWTTPAYARGLVVEDEKSETLPPTSPDPNDDRILIAGPLHGSSSG
jgi:hypothetical protein